MPRPPLSTLFPYTTLFRSRRASACASGRPRTCRRSGERSGATRRDRKSTRLNSSHLGISYAVFCLKKKNPRGRPDRRPAPRRRRHRATSGTSPACHRTHPHPINPAARCRSPSARCRGAVLPRKGAGFFSNHAAPPVIYALSLHDALPISTSVCLRERSPSYMPPIWGTVWCDSSRSEEHTSELQSLRHLVCRLLLEKKKPARAPGPPTGTPAAPSPGNQRDQSGLPPHPPSSDQPGGTMPVSLGQMPGSCASKEGSRIFFESCRAPRYLRSFPTRRSSDLDERLLARAVALVHAADLGNGLVRLV